MSSRTVVLTFAGVHSGVPPNIGGRIEGLSVNESTLILDDSLFLKK